MGGLPLNINEERKIPKAPHCVSMEDRCKISLTGINEVDSFDEQTITVITDCGELSIRGSGLHIGKLSTDTGELSVVGRVDALVYSDREVQQTGFFGSVFR